MLCAPEREGDGEEVSNLLAKQTERSGFSPRSGRAAGKLVVAWVVVVVLVPITFRVPLLSVFIPPAMAVFPAPFPRRHQVSTLLRCLRAIPAMFLSFLVQFVID